MLSTIKSMLPYAITFLVVLVAYDMLIKGAISSNFEQRNFDVINGKAVKVN